MNVSLRKSCVAASVLRRTAGQRKGMYQSKLLELGAFDGSICHFLTGLAVTHKSLELEPAISHTLTTSVKSKVRVPRSDVHNPHARCFVWRT